MSTVVKTIKNYLTDDTIYPITKASAVYMEGSTNTVEGLLGNTDISSIENGTITGAISKLNNMFDFSNVSKMRFAIQPEYHTIVIRFVPINYVTIDETDYSMFEFIIAYG